MDDKNDKMIKMITIMDITVTIHSQLARQDIDRKYHKPDRENHIINLPTINKPPQPFQFKQQQNKGPKRYIILT